jgi:hypothetical protein
VDLPELGGGVFFLWRECARFKKTTGSTAAAIELTQDYMIGHNQEPLPLKSLLLPPHCLTSKEEKCYATNELHRADSVFHN